MLGGRRVGEGRGGEPQGGDAPGGSEVCEDPKLLQGCHTRYLAPAYLQLAGVCHSRRLFCSNETIRTEMGFCICYTNDRFSSLKQQGSDVLQNVFFMF